MTGNLAIVGDLLNACAHPEVAKAALFALKNETIEKVRVVAARRRQSLGVCVAQEVKRFAGHAGEEERKRLARRMSAAPTPIAAGLEAILETTPPGA